MNDMAGGNPLRTTQSYDNDNGDGGLNPPEADRSLAFVRK